MSNTVRFFNKCFEIIDVNTPELVDEAYKLRYQVYCEEKGYEDARQFPDGREYDEYDHRAAHCLIRHRDSGLYVGVVRLVLPHCTDPDQLLPTEHHSQLAKHPELSQLPRQRIAEISRFSVSKTFRRRLAEEGVITGLYDEATVHPRFDRRLLPHITVGLIIALIRMCRDHGIDYCYAVMEPGLLRLLTRFGIHFKVVGEPVNHRGIRLPAFFSGKDLMQMMYKRPDIWSLLDADRAPAVNQSGYGKQTKSFAYI